MFIRINYDREIMKNYKNIFAGIVISFAATFISVAQIEGKVGTDPGKEKYLPNTVVYIDFVDKEINPPAINPKMNQKGLKFIPHVLPVVEGTTVDFLNSDDVLHNVFSPDACADKFNLGTWPKNEVRSFKYEKLGCESVLLCNVHPEMEAFVIVLQNPYFAVSDASGNFKIENVPPGNYTLKVWNERLRSKDQEISVAASGLKDLKIHLGK
jgi:plastocyanin